MPLLRQKGAGIYSFLLQQWTFLKQKQPAYGKI